MKRALVVWAAMLVVASVNGAIREALFIPRMGQLIGRAVSTLSLCGVIALLTYITIAWIRPRCRRETWFVGGLWVALTLGFEFLAGHFLFGNPWNQLLEDYNVLSGRVWVLVLVTIAIAPRLCAHARRLLPDRSC